MSKTELTAEEKLKEAKQLLAEARFRTKEQKAHYVDLKDSTILSLLPKLEAFSQQMQTFKNQIYQDLHILLDARRELYKNQGRKYDTDSITFTMTDKSAEIKIGRNTVDAWDDTVEEGIVKIDAYLQSLSNGEKDEKYLKIIRKLLTRNKKGDLKASRLLELKEASIELGSPELLDEGIEIIERSHKSERTSLFITAWKLDENGKKQNIPLSISQA